MFSRISSRLMRIFLMQVHTDPFNISQPRSGEKISGKVCSKKFDQGPVDPDPVFNRDRFCVQKIVSKVRLKNSEQIRLFFPCQTPPQHSVPTRPPIRVVKNVRLVGSPHEDEVSALPEPGNVVRIRNGLEPCGKLLKYQLPGIFPEYLRDPAPGCRDILCRNLPDHIMVHGKIVMNDLVS